MSEEVEQREALAAFIDQAEMGHIPGTNVTEHWTDRVAYAVMHSDWLQGYVAARVASAAAERDAATSGPGCSDCGLAYGEPGWCDTHVPDDVWAKISPTGDEGGFLCLTCMARRIEALGLENVPLMVTSGPWAHEPTSAYQEGWRTGHEVAAAENAALSVIANEFSAMLDATYPASLDGEAHRWRRLAKVHEEAGEVIEALLGCVAENPRKGRSHDIHDVYRELLDVAFCAVAACAHLNANEGDVLADLTAHASVTHARLRAVLAAAHDEGSEQQGSMAPQANEAAPQSDSGADVGGNATRVIRGAQRGDSA